MTFASPEWFLLIPAALFIGWFWKDLRLFSPLRFILIAIAASWIISPAPGATMWQPSTRRLSAQTTSFIITRLL